MFKNIMLAVDGSTYTDPVLSMGIELARAFNSYLRVLSVADIRVFEWATAIGSDGFVPIAPTGLYQKESMRLLEEKCDKVLEKTSQILNESRVLFETEKMVASPANAILERSHLSDLVILGKCGEFSRWDQQRLGATIQIVSRNIHKPVIVTDKESRSINHILIGYDGSPNANQALQFSGHLAEKLHSRVTLLSVTDDEKIGQHYINEARDYLKNYNIELDHIVLPGTPDKEIVKFAKENKVDLIAIGAYGHSKLREMLLGSNTEHILRHSSCHVMLAR